ncbi:protein CLP1 homolog [Trichogramma pretiosum]|uniref:protein CLP1 homolog n=1 Tax=Trichogramma pretiosum TaxID=7493 RepID=UPI0006C9BE49|nr:protein CLP1 homolog [Trichogramma pretiosum]
MVEEEHTQEFILEKECELRFEVESKGQKVELELKSGLAEVFGTELVKQKKYKFSNGSKVAVFTWHGCTLQLTGRTEVAYIAKETPMSIYSNCHQALEELRKKADDDDLPGPVVMIVGPRDVGKTTLCKILLNYAARMHRRPTYIDLDVTRAQICMPGCIGAIRVERQLNPAEGFHVQSPLTYHFGKLSPNDNIDHYNIAVTELAKHSKLTDNKKTKISGTIINTPAWVKGESEKLILHAIESFKVDAVLVLDQERLYNELVKIKPESLKAILIPKSGGVVAKSQLQRDEIREIFIKEYFYGGRIPLYPHSFEVKWSDVNIFKIGAPLLPSSCMPVGMKVEDNSTKIVNITPSLSILHHVLCVTFAQSAETIFETNLAGFVVVTNVDVDRQCLTLLSPQPGPLMHNHLILSDLQFMDTH